MHQILLENELTYITCLLKAQTGGAGQRRGRGGSRTEIVVLCLYLQVQSGDFVAQKQQEYGLQTLPVTSHRANSQQRLQN